MPPHVTYWTGVWDPDREANSKEIDCLRRALQPHAPVFSFAPHQRSRLRIQQRAVTVNARWWIPFRAVTAIAERLGDVSHVFGGLNSWHLIRALSHHAILFTVTIPGPTLEQPLLSKVACFAVETPCLRQTLLEASVSPDKIRIIYPGIDLARFAVTPPPQPPPFRILFASSPKDLSELNDRGINHLIEIARALPEVMITIPWRIWGDLGEAQGALHDLDLPSNFVVQWEVRPRMQSYFSETHVTACCYAPGFGKAVPNSIVESLASGRPVLVSESCGIATLVREYKAGVVTDRTVNGTIKAIDKLRATWTEYAENARRLAKDHFCQQKMIASYKELYAELASA